MWRRHWWMLFLFCTLYTYVSSTPGDATCPPDMSVPPDVPGCVYATTDDDGRMCCREVTVRTCVQWEEVT